MDDSFRGLHNRPDAPVDQKQNEIRHRIFDSIKRIVVSFV